MQALASTFGFVLQSWQTQPVERNRHRRQNDRLQFYIDVNILDAPELTHNAVKTWAKFFKKYYKKAFREEIFWGDEDLEFVDFIKIYEAEKNKDLVPFLENLFTIYKKLYDKTWKRLLHSNDS